MVVVVVFVLEDGRTFENSNPIRFYWKLDALTAPNQMFARAELKNAKVLKLLLIR